MAHTANLKTYPKVHLKHEDYGSGFARIPNGVACNRGSWAKVSHKHFRIWVGLRSLQPRAYSRTEIMRLLNLDRRNGLKDLLAMEEAGLVKADGNSLVVVDPEAGKPQAKTEEDKKEKEQQTKQPATKVSNAHDAQTKQAPRTIPAPIRDTPATPAAISPEVITPPAARVTAPIVRHAQGGSAAPDPGIATELAEAWNTANKDGILRCNVDAGGFSPDVIKRIVDFAAKVGVTPSRVVTRVVWCSLGCGGEYNPWARQGSVPKWVFGEDNSERLREAFLAEIREISNKKARENIQILKSFATDYFNTLGDIAGLDSIESVSEILFYDQTETINLIRETVGEVGVNQARENLLVLSQSLLNKIKDSEEYKAFKANPIKMVAAKELRRKEGGGFILEMRPDAHGEMRSRPVEFDIEKKFSTAGDYFPVFTSTSLPSEAPESVFSLFLKACNHYGVLGAKAQGSSEG